MTPVMMGVTAVSKTKHANVLKFLETVGKDISLGIEAAGPAVGIIDPPVGTIVTAIGNFLHSLLNNQAAPPVEPKQLSSIAQSIATVHTIAAHTISSILPTTGNSSSLPGIMTVTFNPSTSTQ